MKKLTQNEKCFKSAEKALKEFVKTLEKKGFTEEIKKHLNLAWQKDKELFSNAVNDLKGVKFKIEKIKFIERHDPQLFYRFLTEVNGIETHLFVQPLKEGNIPSKDGFFGVTPSKLMKFIPPSPMEFKDAEEEVTQEPVNDIIDNG